MIDSSLRIQKRFQKKIARHEQRLVLYYLAKRGNHKLQTTTRIHLCLQVLDKLNIVAPDWRPGLRDIMLVKSLKGF
jgi:hypothetical protein